VRVWTLFAFLLIAAPRPIEAAPLRTTLAILRQEPLGQTLREQDDALLDAPEADVSRFLSAGEIAKFHAYRRPRWMRGIADLLIQGALFLLLIFGGRGARIHAACVRRQEVIKASVARKPKLGKALRDLRQLLDKAWGASDWLAAILFALALTSLRCLTLWPSSFIFDWLIPRAHGLSDQSLLRWFALALFALCKESIGLAAMAFGLWALLRRVKHAWLWVGVPAGLLIATLGMLDPLSVKLLNQLTPLEPGPARTAIEALLTRSGIEAGQIDRIDAHRDTLAIDAFVIGQGKARRIILYDTLLAALTPGQIAAVVAHELGHLKDGTRKLRAALGGLAVPILLWLALRFLGLAARSRRFEFREVTDLRALPLLLGAAWLCAVLASPIANHLSRDRELRADLFALDLTRDPESLRAALLALARTNQADPAPPFLVATLLADHPTLTMRLGLIDAWETAARAGSR
jgi:STE24 endopeptidase